MKISTNKLFEKIKTFVNKYPLIIAAVLIYAYYLLTSVNFFQNHNTKKGFLDYVLQFDSLFFMWLATAAYVQIQKLRTDKHSNTMRNFQLEKQLEFQQIHTKVVNEISALLQDNVNNPLAVISITTKEIRRKFESDTEIIRWLDRIDSSMQRIHNTIRDIQLYETQKLLEESNTNLSKTEK